MKIGIKAAVCILAVSGIVALSASSAISASLSGIGVIDVQKVFKGYQETSKAQDALAKKDADFKKEFDASQKQIEDAKTAKKSDKEIETLTKDLEAKLSPKRDELMKLNAALSGKLQKDIVTAAQGVAKTMGVDVIFDKQAVITGGVDLTDMVIDKLNGK